MKKTVLILIIVFTAISGYGQINVSLYEQFNGNYDFTFVGNTLNTETNKYLSNVYPSCSILTSSSASLSLTNTDSVLKAYLYWAGSGQGDFTVKLNGQDITATRTFPVIFTSVGVDRPFFSAFADVTSIVRTQGTGTYTVSELDLTDVINQDVDASENLYCQNGTNFGGWVIVVVYGNPALPLNQLNLYDGLQFVPTAVNISLPSLNVIDNDGAKIGFVAWEGDIALHDGETLKINGNTLSNALNPPDNAFNSTNSVTGATDLFNMDLDIYDIENYIHVGDETAEIQLTSNADFVMINAIVTKLNSQLPDATVTVENIAKQCNSRTLQVSCTVHNTNSTDVLPAGTQVGVYVNGTLLTTFATATELPIGGSESRTLTLTIPAGYPENIELLFVADYNFAVTETDETNNSVTINETLLFQANPTPGNLTACASAPGVTTGFFDLAAYGDSLKDDATDVVSFYTSMADAQVPQNPLTGDLSAYQSGPQTLYVRVQDANGCVGYGSFQLLIDDCLFPDATITAQNLQQACDSRTITFDYTVSNTNGLDVLPAGTTIGIYANNVLIATTFTAAQININASLSGTMTVTIPAGIPLSFNLVLKIDNSNTVQEINETNNRFTLPVTLWLSPLLSQPQDITVCETANGSNVGLFDFSGYEQSLKSDPADVVLFYTSQAAATAGGNDNITNPGSFTSTVNPQQIFVRLQDANGCFDTAVFSLIAVDCLFPDGTITLNTISQVCDSRTINVNYTVSNLNSFDILPAGTPVSFYADGIVLATVPTANAIPVGGSITATATLNIPPDMPINVSLIARVDDDGHGTGVVTEVNEANNNSNTFPVSLWVSPVLQQPADITGCETFNGSGLGIFDFSAYANSLKDNTTDVVSFYPTQQDADAATNAITTPNAYIINPDTHIFVSLQDIHGCYDTKVFTLKLIDCYFPDATVVIEDVYKQCNSRVLHVHYTVSNINGTDVLPAGTPVSIYVNGTFLDYTETLENIAIGQSESNYITITIPVGIPLQFNLTFVADDTGDGTGIIVETDENNNGFALPTFLVLSPEIAQPNDIINCDKGFGRATFDFSAYAETLKNYPNETVTFYRSQQTADQALDPIYNANSYQTTENPERIYMRLDNGTCFATASFLLRTKKCAPVTFNYVTPNGDGYNDTFYVEGLRNIFLNFKMSIYNRWGSLVWTGDHSKADWDAIADVEKVGSEGTTAPNSTYYFVLELNDPDFPEPIVGWVYVTK